MTVLVDVRVPDRSLQQRLDALKHANEVRSKRARLKRDVKARRLSWRAAFVHEWCDGMKVYDLLVTVPKIGRVKANRILTRGQISPSKTLAGLSDRQREFLLELVP